MTDEIDTALKIANKIITAIVAKFPKHEGYVRRFAVDEGSGYIQLAIKPIGSSSTHEKAVAYADEFFTSTNKENMNERAKVIYSDFKKLLVG